VARVTVAIAVYNGASTLAAALESVLSQSFTDYDILVLDDGSQDHPQTIVDAFPATYIWQANQGLGAARKRLTELATGEWIAFLDHDDTWHPEKLRRQMDALQTGDVLVHSEGTYVYPDREVERNERFTEDPFAALLPNNRVLASSAIYHRQTLLDAGNFTADTVRCSDWFGWMLLASKGNFRHVPENLIRYHVLESSLANSGFRFFDARRHIIENHFLANFDRFFGSLSQARQAAARRQLRRELALSISGMARSQQRSGNRPEAVQLARRALSLGLDVPKVVTRASGVLLGR